jgi:uncharacterized protein (DUF885 family)
MRTLNIIFLAAFAGACSVQSPEPEISAVEALADEYLAALFEREPTLGTFYSIEGSSHDRLPDNSLEALSEWQRREDTWLATLKEIEEPSDIGSRDWVSYGILRESLESAVALRVCRDPLWQASDATGWHRDLPFLFDIQPVDTEPHRQQTLERLSAVDHFIDTEIANLRTGLDMGYSSPRVTVEAVPGQVRSLIAEDSIFLSPAIRSGDEVFAAAVGDIYRQEIIPAINRFADFIETVYLGQARDELAVTANPYGIDCYPARVRSFVTIQPSADEIHTVGLEQIENISAEMRVTIDEHFGGESIADFMRRINDDPEFTFEAEADVLQYSIDGLDTAKNAMVKAFGTLPIADVLVKPYPDFAASGSGEYHSSSEDGTRPGIFYIAVIDPQARSRSNQLSTLYHETYPGHHLQGAIALELGDKVHPIARYLWNSGYGEGWALYAERLAAELDLYATPLDYMGLYSDQGARAARLVIDSGIHTKGWTRQEAVDYMMDNTGWAPVDIQNEINRYIAWPGQATSYMLGMLEIRRLRNLAENELGETFDLRAFHDRVVGFGSMTLPMLEVSIRAWIEENRTTN